MQKKRSLVPGLRESASHLGDGITKPVVIVVIIILFFVLAGALFASRSLPVKSNSVLSDVPEAAAAETAEEEETAATVVIDVAGEVCAPGVYALPEGSRVNDALAAAGGVNEVGVTSAVNLARVLNDGEQIVIPSLDEVASAALTPSGAAPAADNGMVNINTADEATLETLPGIGEVTATRIVSDREQNGPFASPEDLKRVSGIGDKKYEALAGLICV